ncbi:MAG: lysophospholipid acyltransferase family protein [Gammaproteobacteria bacterium]
METALLKPRRRKPVRAFLMKHVVPPLALAYYRSLAGSWHYETHHAERFEELLAAGQPVVGAFLHARTFQLLHYFSLPGRGRWILMCSQSRDGDAMTRVEEGLGFRVARGSSGKGGARALVEMIKAQRDDRSLNSCLAIDGSRGPRGVAQLGIITLAQKAGGVILPVAAASAGARIWEKSWDRTVFPRRGATVHVGMGEPLPVPAKLDAVSLEALRLELERRTLSLHREMDLLAGFHDTEPLQCRE